MKIILFSTLLLIGTQVLAESYDECTTKCNDTKDACYVNSCGNATGPAVITCQAHCDKARLECFNVTCAGKSSLDTPKNWILNRASPVLVESKAVKD